MEMTRRLFHLHWLVWFLVAVPILSACAPAAPSPTSAPAKPAESKSAAPAPAATSPSAAQPAQQPAAKAPQVVKLVAWTIGPDEPSHNRKDNLVDAAKALNKELEAQGSNVRVELEATFEGTGTNWGDYKQKFVLASEAGNAPDIMFSSHLDIAAWSEAGYIQPIDQYIQQEQKYLGDVVPNLWKAMTFKSKIWGIPQSIEARPWYYRQDYLRKLGWTDQQIKDLPEKVLKGEFTMQDVVELAKQAQDKGLVKAGNGLWFRPVNGVDWYINYYNFGGEAQDANGNLMLDTKAFQKELEFYRDAVFKHKVTKEKYLGLDWKSFQTAWVNGDMFTIPAGTWFWGEWVNVYKAPEDQLFNNVAYTLYPAAEKGGKPLTLSQPVAYMISAKSKNPELAAKIIARATTPELHSRHAVKTGTLAILKSQANDPTYKQSKFVQSVGYMVDYTRYLPMHKDFGAYDTALWQARSAVFAGQLTPEQAVKAATDQLKASVPGVVIK